MNGKQETSALDDILGLVNETKSQPQTQANPVLDLLGGSDVPPIVETSSNDPPPVVESVIEEKQETVSQARVYSEDDLHIDFTYSKENEKVCKLETTISTTSTNEFSEVQLQIAVPKNMQLQMLSPSGNTLNSSTSISQTVRINNPEQSQLRLRLRFVYNINGEQVVKMAEATGIPENWA